MKVRVHHVAPYEKGEKSRHDLLFLFCLFSFLCFAYLILLFVLFEALLPVIFKVSDPIDGGKTILSLACPPTTLDGEKAARRETGKQKLSHVLMLT